jgi:hypothetical protein
MGYKNNDPCIKKAFDDERLFVLMARDAAAPYAIMQWISRSLKTQPPEKLHEALDCALEMLKTSGLINNRKAAEKAQAIQNFRDLTE